MNDKEWGKPPKGIFTVKIASFGSDPITVLTTAPEEPRPFPRLKALDIEAVAKQVLEQHEAQRP